MHFVTGGSFNGKRAWVKQHYNLTLRDEYIWISQYENASLPTDVNHLSHTLVVLEGLENWIRHEVMRQDQPEFYWEQLLERWMDWERQTTKQMILIGTDITKGIVPISSEERNWRDLTGRCYQQISKHASRVDLIWYGIHQTIKSEAK
ncbi:bifunctional adenosylcobinamide kinase/adenosylcobinamide-phosphate guanylyltransferase [Pseudalkalibacillus sp. Hm43]|uniref:bifunctional adenosylcobinamide kinase/adenosylcobinamide-phosphate guanylyltransferase n=1 Tax=Pseudalkalibacillus sp. Hm43 TaxID=3450742 RepID=UPI003F427C51